jgi:YidC/Oxa1 family membrane protein insertase
MPSFLYTLIIFPLEQFIELAYVLVYKIFHDRALATLGVSVAVSVCTLPLYFIAEKHQQAEREIEKRLRPKIKTIKTVFSGDEQYMILSAYYRQNHYHPVYALRSSLGLLIQIPFFIAAYSYLSHLESIKGVSFLFIKDLGAPDAVVSGTIGAGFYYSLNILPILMTLINCVAGAVYTKGLAVKEKVQLYGMALIFLVLLYNSPAGLVLYWTMNNIFSLIKNCLQKIKNSKKVVYLFLCLCAVLLDIYALFIRSGPMAKRLLLAAICSCIFLKPLFVRLYVWAGRRIAGSSLSRDTVTGQVRTFVLSTAILFVLAGLVIPGALIASSVQEFSFIENYTSPFPFIGETLLQSAGIFLFWPLCFYFLFTKKTKKALAVFMSLFCAIALIDTFIFPGDYGFLTQMLQFTEAPQPSFFGMCLNAAVLIIALLLFLYVLLSGKKLIFSSFQVIALVSLVGFGTINVVKIHRDYTEFAARADRAVSAGAPEPLYSFSTNGKNVIVIMMDRGISGYIPYIFKEKPELAEAFSGFTYYPNCISFGGHTLFGAPALFGGYEYAPLELQKRSGETLVKKHNQSLLVLPKLFLENGFAVTVTDPALPNYSWVPDLSIYDEYPGIRADNIIGKYTDYWLRDYEELNATSISFILKANLIRFSFFKFMPVAGRNFAYDNGDWFGTLKIGIPQANINSYVALNILPDITTVTDSDTNTLTVITNDLTHEPAFFQTPGYIPAPTVVVKDTGPFTQESHYHVNMAACLLLGKWFSFLKANNVYDNTRIIIVSDHGFNLSDNFPGNIVLPNGQHLETYNALLLVKDFNASGAPAADDSFMTNADVPFLAADGLFARPENPFTHVPLQGGKDGGATIFTSILWDTASHGDYVFKEKADEWLHVRDNIHDPANWKRAGR